MARLYLRGALPACAAALLAAGTTPAWADTDSFYLGPEYTVDGHEVDHFDSSQVRWMKSQALYWRRQEYSGLHKEAGTADYYRKGDLIAAQVKLDYAKIDLQVVKDPVLATRDLEDAMASIKAAEAGASKDELADVKQVTDELDRLKGKIANPPRSKSADQAVEHDLGQAAQVLKHIVERG